MTKAIKTNAQYFDFNYMRRRKWRRTANKNTVKINNRNDNNNIM